MLTQEQIAEIRRANLSFLFDFGNQVVENVAKLATLNARATQSTLEMTFDLAQKSVSMTEPRELLDQQRSAAALMADRLQTYCREVFDLVPATQAELARIGRAKRETYGRQMKSVVRDVARNAPASSEATMTTLDSAIAAVDTLYETLQSSGYQAVQATCSNLEIASTAAKTDRRAIDPVLQGAKR